LFRSIVVWQSISWACALLSYSTWVLWFCFDVPRIPAMHKED
jgi:hypothetical protein